MNLFEETSLHSERRVIALHNDIEDATARRVLCDFVHSVAKSVERFAKTRENGGRIRRASGDVVLAVVRVDDGQPVCALVCE